MILLLIIITTFIFIVGVAWVLLSANQARKKSKIISGKVLPGKQRGRDFGFPTVNLTLSDQSIDAGIYGGKACFDNKEYLAAIFIPKERNILEAYILDFEGDLYNKEIKISIGQKIREIIKFESERAQMDQILDDVQKIRDSKL